MIHFPELITWNTGWILPLTNR